MSFASLHLSPRILFFPHFSLSPVFSFFSYPLSATSRYAQSYLISGNSLLDPAFPFSCYHMTITLQNQKILKCLQICQIIFTLILYRFINIRKIYELPFHKPYTIFVVMKLESNESLFSTGPYCKQWIIKQLTSNKYQASDDWVSKWVVEIVVSIMKGQSRERLF